MYRKIQSRGDSFFLNFGSVFRETDGDDDIIFEDFARLRLKGETDA